MKVFRFVASVAVVVVNLTGGASAQVSQQRTYVSAVNGSNANFPCPRTAPCATFQVALDWTLSGGTVTMLDNGDYQPLEIAGFFIIEGQGAGTRIKNSSSYGVLVSDANARIVLRNFSIDAGYSGRIGIDVAAASSVSVENVTIVNQLESDAIGIKFAPPNNAVLHLKNVSIGNSGSGSTIGGGIVIGTAATGVTHKVNIEDSSIDYNSRGILLSGNASTQLTVANSTVSHNFGDAVLVNPGAGTTKLTIKDSELVNNGGNGLMLAPTGGAKVNTTIVSSAFDGNVIGIRSFPAIPAVSNLSISDTSVSNNAGGVHASGKSVVGIIRGNVSGNSSYGITAVSPAAVRVGSSMVNGNTLGLSGPVSSYGNNQLLGNTTQGSATAVPPGGMP